MTHETIIFQANELHGMAIAAAKKDVRYYLQGILIECQQGKPARLVATDGHILACYDTGHECETTASAIMPLDALKQIPKKGSVEIIMTPQEGKPAEFTIKTGAAVLQVFAIDGRFPDYRRIIPTELPTEQSTALYNPDLLLRLRKCAETVLDLKNTHALPLYQTGDNAAMTWCGNNWAGVAMPIRSSAVKITPTDARFAASFIKREHVGAEQTDEQQAAA
jgi:DNA polymerase-3 subunit beta